MWLLKTILFVVLLAMLVIVALANDIPVPLHLFGWHVEQAPLFLVMFGAALVGLLGGLLMTAIREVQFRMVLSRQARDKNLLEREVRDLRAAPIDGLGDEEPATSAFSRRAGRAYPERRS